MNLDLGYTRLLIETCRQHGLLRNETAYVLATAYHETAHRMEPVREALADSDDEAIRRLDRAWERGQLSWVSKPYWRDGWFGRGFVQLTHLANYKRASRELGVDLVADPSQAMDPEISALICVRGMAEGWFTGKQLSDYLDLKRSDYVGARRIVNGTDRARAIAEYAREYEAALLAEGYGVEKLVPVANERRDGTPPRESVAQSTTMRAVAAVAGSGGTGVWTAVQSLEGTSQHIVIAATCVAALGILWITRERWLKWLEGDR
jgi:hypothetical protein